MTDKSAVQSVVAAIIADFGRLDVLINNAGLMPIRPMAEVNTDEWDQMIDVNLKGTLYGIAAALPGFLEQGSGHIINLSSVAGDKGGRGQSNYAASKGAINAFTRAMAVELASRKITVNCVAPGVIETEMSQQVRDLADDQIKARILLRRYGQAQDVAHAVWFLASRFADYITGQVLHVDGGFKME